MSNSIISSKGNPRIRITPKMSLAALERKEDKEFWLWLCARSIDPDPSRYVLKLTDVMPILIESYGYTEQTVYKHLRLGNGTYWRLINSKATVNKPSERFIVLSGVEKVIRHLEVNLTMRDRQIDIPIEHLPGSSELQAKRALLFMTAVYKPFVNGGKYTRPISQTSLEDKSGVNQRTQRRYNRNLAVKGHGMLVIQRTPTYRRDPETYNLRHCSRTVYKGPFDTPVEVHTLGNRYHSFYSYGSKGMLYRIARKLKAEKQSLINRISENETPVKTESKKRFFTSFRAFCNAHIKHQTSELECYYPTRNDRMVLCEIWAS